MKLHKALQSLYLAHLGRYSKPGTRSWLIEREIRYGGFVTDVRRSTISALDPRDPQGLASGGMVGGDRMSPRHHDYGLYYARYLKPIVARDTPVTLIEVGILQGTGLAIWSDLFPKGRIIGLDIDISHFETNLDHLLHLGAFKAHNHSVHAFDGFVDNTQYIGDILREDSVDIVIDDASHVDDSILVTFESLRPHLTKNFLYLVEDNKRVHANLIERYPQYDIRSFFDLTVVTDPD